MAECILFGLDVDPEAGLCPAESIRVATKLDIMKQTILTLAASKESAQLVQSPTSNLDVLTAALTNIKPSPSAFTSFELGSLAPVCQTARLAAADACGCAIGDAPGVRVVLLYCRSGTIPRWRLNHNLPVAVDVLYMHSSWPTPSTGNCAQDVFTALEEHCDAMATAAGHHAYIYECNAGNVKKWLNIMLWMLCHPKQRRPQSQLPVLPPDLSVILKTGNGSSGYGLGSAGGASDARDKDRGSASKLGTLSLGGAGGTSSTTKSLGGVGSTSNSVRASDSWLSGGGGTGSTVKADSWLRSSDPHPNLGPSSANKVENVQLQRPSSPSSKKGSPVHVGANQRPETPTRTGSALSLLRPKTPAP